MKRHIIKVITIALFVCTNIATFLFAQGRVQIIEKIVTVYKERKEPAYVASLGKGTASGSRGTNLPQVVDSGEEPCDFGDPGYPAGENTASIPDSDRDAVMDIAANKEEEASDQPRQYGGAFYPYYGGHNPGDPSFPPSPSFPPPPHDDTIPIPQLPLCGADFEVASGERSFSGIAPPPLPEIEELQ